MILLYGDRQLGVNISFLCPCMESKEKTAILLTTRAFGLPIVFLYGEVQTNGDRPIKKSRYIPKRLLTRVQNMEAEKAPLTYPHG